MLCCPHSCRHADIPESSICYTGALLDSVIKSAKKVQLFPKCSERFLLSGKGGMGRAVGRSSLLRGPEAPGCFPGCLCALHLHCLRIHRGPTVFHLYLFISYILQDTGQALLCLHPADPPGKPRKKIFPVLVQSPDHAHLALPSAAADSALETKNVTLRQKKMGFVGWEMSPPVLLSSFWKLKAWR